MFTGIIEEVGKIRTIKRGAYSATLEITANLITADLHIGDSVATNGICLTATSVNPHGFTADAMPETLNRTNLGALSPGSRVNLERAVAVGSRLGGHIVSGHIDGLAEISAIRRDDNAIWYDFSAPPPLLRYIIEKGSVALDGISLTVARVDSTGFAVSLIPHTAAHTTFSDRKIGDKINLECDIIGKYVEKLITAAPEKPSAITPEFLSRCGF